MAHEVGLSQAERGLGGGDLDLLTEGGHLSNLDFRHDGTAGGWSLWLQAMEAGGAQGTSGRSSSPYLSPSLCSPQSHTQKGPQPLPCLGVHTAGQGSFLPSRVGCEARDKEY